MGDQTARRPIKYDLAQFLGPDASISALIVLNGPTLPSFLLAKLLAQHPASVILADGAANHVLAAYPDFIPTYVVGDLDSISAKSLSHYRKLGVRIHRDADMHTNDFEKALQIAQDIHKNGTIAVIGGHDGRFDQTLANLNTLLFAAARDIRLVWFQPQCAVIALSAGGHVISIDPVRDGPACGLIPVFSPVRSVFTTGLRWNLSNQPLRYGGLISSSNLAEERSVTVETSDPVLWTMELRITE